MNKHSESASNRGGAGAAKPMNKSAALQLNEDVQVQSEDMHRTTSSDPSHPSDITSPRHPTSTVNKPRLRNMSGTATGAGSNQPPGPAPAAHGYRPPNYNPAQYGPLPPREMPIIGVTKNYPLPLHLATIVSDPEPNTTKEDNRKPKT